MQDLAGNMVHLSSCRLLIRLRNLEENERRKEGRGYEEENMNETESRYEEKLLSPSIKYQQHKTKVKHVHYK